MKKITVFTLGAMLLFGATAVQAANIGWDGGGTTTAWGTGTSYTDAVNWANNTLPGTGDWAMIDGKAGQTHTIEVLSGQTGYSSNLRIANIATTTVNLIVRTGGTMESAGSPTIGQAAGTTGSYTIESGATAKWYGISVGGSTAASAGATGTLNVYGNAERTWVNTGNAALINIGMGTSAGEGTGIMNVYDGAMIGSATDTTKNFNWIRVGKAGDATLNMNGGEIYLGVAIQFATDHAGASGVINLNDGLIQVKNTAAAGSGVTKGLGTASMVVKDGVMKLWGNQWVTLASDGVTAGSFAGLAEGTLPSWITAYTGYTLHADYIESGADAGFTKIWATVPEPATLALFGLGSLLFVRRK